MSYSKTINPLHFEDLEPHRFEDLVRQLMYDFKDWKSIEATGRLGSDDGIDILAIENSIEESYEVDGKSVQVIKENEWIIQCKREKVLNPKKVADIIENDIGQQEQVPYGYILVASSNFSKKARDVFKIKLNELGVSEFYIYGKAELEDLLFLPKYDHLLFAYFGLSLHKRKRSMKSNLSSRLTTKRKLVKILGELNEESYEHVLVRPAQEEDYPHIKNDVITNWRYYEFAFHQPVDCISLITKKHYAYIDWESKEWDIIENYDYGFPTQPRLFDLTETFYESLHEKHYKTADKWNELDEANKAFFIEVKPIHLDRILLIDDIGDCYNESPHLIVEYLNNSPFENRQFVYIESGKGYSSRRLKEPDISKRIKVFK